MTTQATPEKRGAALVSARRRKPGERAFLLLLLGGALLIGTWISLHALSAHSNDTRSTTPKAHTSARLPPLQLPTEEVEPVREDEQTVVPSIAPGDPTDLLTKRRLSGGFGEEALGNVSISASKDAVSSSDHAATPLSEQLKPLVLQASEAGVLGDRDWLMTRGTVIACALQTQIDSDVPGMVSCYTTEDVYSDNGRVVLIDKGSKVTGQYQNGLQIGQARLFVAWQRLETPEGVILDLNSPGTDPLGGAGMPGVVDEHFWQRFGSAIFLSVLEDAGQVASNMTTRMNGNTTISFGNTSQATGAVLNNDLERSLSIPPTLYKHQGDTIAIFVARDLSFSSVYAFRTRKRPAYIPTATLPRKISHRLNRCEEETCA